MATPKTYKQLVKTFKFRDKKPSESPKAYISARGKAMGKEWRKIKAALEKKSGAKKAPTTKKKALEFPFTLPLEFPTGIITS